MSLRYLWVILLCLIAQGDDIYLKSAGTFNALAEVPKSLQNNGLQVHFVKASNTELSLIACPGTTPERCLLVRTDLYGHFINAIDLGKEYIVDFSIDDNGNSFFLSGLTNHYRMFNKQGKVIRDLPKTAVVRIISGGKGKVSPIDAHGTLYTNDFLPRQEQMKAALPDLGDPSIQPLIKSILDSSGNIITFIDKTTASIKTIDITSATIHRRAVDHDIIRQAKETYNESPLSPGMKNILIADAQSTFSGTGVLLLIPGRIDRGVGVLLTDQIGNIRKSFRCRLVGGSAPIGTILPHGLTSNSEFLFLWSPTGDVLSYYLESSAL